MCIYIFIFGCSIYDYIYIHMLETIGKVMISQTHVKTPKLKIWGKWFETLNWTMNFINHENIGKVSINVYISSLFGIIWILHDPAIQIPLSLLFCLCVYLCIVYICIYLSWDIFFVSSLVASRSSTLLLHCSSLRRIDGSLGEGGSMVS